MMTNDRKPYKPFDGRNHTREGLESWLQEQHDDGRVAKLVRQTLFDRFGTNPWAEELDSEFFDHVEGKGDKWRQEVSK